MRNYKLNTVKGWGALGQRNEYTKDKHDKLIAMGWSFNELFRQYRKSVVPYYEAVLDLDKDMLYFYSSRFFTPAELNIYVGNDKATLNKIYNAIKEIKDQGYFK